MMRAGAYSYPVSIYSYVCLLFSCHGEVLAITQLDCTGCGLQSLAQVTHGASCMHTRTCIHCMLKGCRFLDNSTAVQAFVP